MTADQAILNNVNLTSQQDTLYAGNQAGSTSCSGTCIAARQYMWQGIITGDVDYVFGDAALVFDHTNFFTTWHGASATGMAEALLRQGIFPQSALGHVERALNLFQRGPERIISSSQRGAIMATKAWTLAACGH